MNVFRCSLIVLLGLSFFATEALAQRKYVVTSNYSGVQSSKGGFRSIELTVATADGQPVSRDVQMNLCLSQGGWRERKTVSTPLIIKEGRTSGSASLVYNCNALSRSAMFWVERDLNRVYDRRDIYRESIDDRSWESPNGSYLFVSSTVKPKVPITVQAESGAQFRTGGYVESDVGEGLPSFHQLASILYGNPVADQASALRSSVGLDTELPSGLPENWIELSSVQHIVISLSDLKQFGNDYPESLEAMKKWMSAGGRLVVNSCGDNGKNANQICRVLGVPEASMDDWLRAKENAWKKYWAEVNVGNGVILEPEFLRRDRNQKMFFDEYLVSATDQSSGNGASKSKLMSLPFGQGQIVATDDDMSDWSKSDWHRLIVTMEVTSGDFHTHIGEYVLNNQRVMAKVIPGVKEPPPAAFQLLIVCFVIAVGPLNYFLLRRTQRLNVLLITVPLISLFACLLLFGYAIFVQGFGMKVRHDSVTFLDQRNNVAVNRSLHCIFSGLHPGRHSFPDDQLVFLANDDFEDTFIRLENGTVSYSGGPIQARLPHQLSTVDAFNTEAGLRFNEKDGELQVRSDFDDSIICLLVAYNGKHYQVENLEPGAVGTAEEVDQADINRIFSVALNEILPDELLRRDYQYWGLNNHIIDGRKTTPLLSSNTYMAVFEEYNGARPIRGNLKKKHGVHVVIGRW